MSERLNGMEQTIVITGCTRGIGRVAALALRDLHPDAHLVLLCRNENQPELLQELGGQAKKNWFVQVDLSSMHRVAAAAGEIARLVESGTLPPIGALVCNAGVQFSDAIHQTVDGFEETFAVNVLANHLLLRCLEEFLIPQGRVVITVSDTHFGDFKHNLGLVPAPQWRDMSELVKPGAFANPTTRKAGLTAYSTSKLAAIYLIHAYARRLPVTVVGYNPGWVPATDLTRDIAPFARFLVQKIMPILTVTPLAYTAEQSGKHLAEAASGYIAASSGSYIEVNYAEPSSPESYDEAREERAWAEAEELTSPFRNGK